MRVLHLGKYYPPFAGGMENYLFDLQAALTGLGVEVAVLAHDHAGRGERRADPRVWLAPAHGRLLFVPVSPGFPGWLQRVTREFRPDLVHFHLPNASAFWALGLRRLRRLPWVLHWHSDVDTGSSPALRLGYRFYRPWEQALLARAEAVIATSPPYLAASRALAPWRHKTRVIPLGRAEDCFPPLDDGARRFAEACWGDARARILAVGRDAVYKGYRYLLAALASAPGARLVLVGEGTRRRLSPLVGRLGLGERVRLVDGQSAAHTAALFASCHALCLPSTDRAEAFGVVLLEAMMQGKPVIAGDVPGSGIGWVVEQGRTGVLVAPGDSAALAAALRDLLDNPGTWRAMGESSRRRYRDRFRIRDSAGRLAELYASVLRARGGRG